LESVTIIRNAGHSDHRSRACIRTSTGRSDS
jgi:hypothetical protein